MSPVNSIGNHYDIDLIDTDTSTVLFEGRCIIAIRCMHICDGTSEYIYHSQKEGKPVTKQNIIDIIGSSTYTPKCHECVLRAINKTTDVQVEALFIRD